MSYFAIISFYNFTKEIAEAANVDLVGSHRKIFHESENVMAIESVNMEFTWT